MMSTSLIHLSLSVFQLWLPDHVPRGGSEAAAGSVPQRASFRPLVSGLLGGLDLAWPAVSHLPVPLRWLPHGGRPQPQRPPGRPGGVRTRPDASQLPHLLIQCHRLRVCLPLILLLEQGRLLLLQDILRDSSRSFHAWLLRCFASSAAPVSKRSPATQDREPATH